MIHKNKEKPYPTSLNLIEHLKKEAPNDLQYLIKDLFETVTFYDNKINATKVKSISNGNQQITIEFDVKKYRNKNLKKSLSLKEYIELGFYNEHGELISIETTKVIEKNNKITFQLNEKPSKIILDPNYLLIDKNVEGNVKEL